MMKQRFLLATLVLVFLVAGCKKKTPDLDIQDCDKIYNYYEDGIHYIRRDIVSDDGVIDYDKLLEDSKIKRSDCYPGKDVELESTIGE
jgi:hypothetical protein